MATMCRKCGFWLSLFGALWCIECTAAHAQIVISEVMFNPKGSEFFDEYIELFHIGDAPVDLTGWRVGMERAPMRLLAKIKA